MEIQENQQYQPPKMSIMKLNLLIFAGYSILGFLMTFAVGFPASLVGGGNDLGLGIAFYGFMIHEAVLLLISIGWFFYGLSKNIKTRAGEYFLTALLLLLLGPGLIFVTCLAAFS